MNNSEKYPDHCEFGKLVAEICQKHVNINNHSAPFYLFKGKKRREIIEGKTRIKVIYLFEAFDCVIAFCKSRHDYKNTEKLGNLKEKLKADWDKNFSLFLGMGTPQALNLSDDNESESKLSSFLVGYFRAPRINKNISDKIVYTKSRK